VNWIVIGGVWGCIGVALGALGAHQLKETLGAEQLEWWSTAALYHLLHAPAIALAGLVQISRGRGGAAGWALFIGSLVFSGTLYALALGAPSWLGAITPIGGLGLMAGWVLLALAGRSRPDGARR